MSESQLSKWVWYPGDYEIWLHGKVSVLRQFRGYIVPPLWRLDSAYTNVKFRRQFDLPQPEELTISVQGEFALHLDNNMTPIPYEHQKITSVLIPTGKHELTISVFSDQVIPAIYSALGLIADDGGEWEVTAHNGKWVKAGSGVFNDIDIPPQKFPFSYETIIPVSVTDVDGGILVDFGRETFGYVQFLGVVGKGVIQLYYGESREEALAEELAETYDKLAVDVESLPQDYASPVTRAFRYIKLKADEGVSWRELSHEYEYLPLQQQGSFRCSEARINQIWEVSAHTLHMNMREFIYDGMKRDRWVWSGDANLGFLINNYVFFDQAVTKRTLIALRGKEPIETHMNTIMDYTFYWFISLHDYYLYTGDIAFVQANYPKMLSLLEFCLNRRNKEGMMEGQPDDWIFVDWAEMDRRGELSFEQLLFCRSLEIVAIFANVLADHENGSRLEQLARELKERIFSVFWNQELGGFIHSRLDGELNKQLLKYPSMFALRFGYLNAEQEEQVRQNVLLEETVQKIKTPFMRFFELEALCNIGEQAHVLGEIRDYWGGMLDLGATTFWEEYDPALADDLQYDMYGDKFRKSLCHAWGAAPIYLLGKYGLGVTPEEPGYKQYRVKPNLCGLDWIEGTIPTPNGELAVFMDKSRIRVHTNRSGVGILEITSEQLPTANEGIFQSMGNKRYELMLDRPEFLYEILY
ncbi:alpha-rhamnosidase [Paenibacillus psychroresistens]|uniref:Alpha-rhamnosidase n=1 Tax=Paenibacillus psychroresistens TaxID=1778678 RepID=A0A6B8RU19_9BACL|nr:alpha-L-rhamnosidase C-terminal domain-containing protein [Paenibacillus psychroresistens]QGQ99282.1 alpha-rhamnosidase [Paenibacillus psychroresistens]